MEIDELEVVLAYCHYLVQDLPLNYKTIMSVDQFFQYETILNAIQL